MTFKLYLPILCVVFCISCTTKQKKPEISNIAESYIFEAPVTPSCHASTIVEIEPNHLMVAWFGGSAEGNKDVGIYLSSNPGGSWSAPRNIVTPLITEEDTLPCWNPVLFKSSSEHLYLFYKVGKNPREWFGAMLTSSDDGKTWSDPQYLPEGILGPIRNKPIETKPGLLLCGSSTESVESNEWRVHVETYDESAGKWQKIPVQNTKNFEVIQPTFLVHAEGKIQMLCRSKHDRLVTSWSEDVGASWSDMEMTEIVNSNSGVDAISLTPDSFLLVNNPLPRGANWYNGRNMLDVEYSTDGIQWEKLLDLENQEKGEFSYPAIIQTSDDKVHIVYTYDREYIKHVSFDVDR